MSPRFIVKLRIIENMFMIHALEFNELHNLRGQSLMVEPEANPRHVDAVICRGSSTSNKPIW